MTDKRKDGMPKGVVKESTSSHVPILRKAVEILSPKSVLEFGCGQFSTLMFLDMGIEVTVIDEPGDWFNWIAPLVPRAHNGIDEADTDQEFKLVFVDGSRRSRRPAIEWSLERDDVQTIIYHDADDPTYNWPKTMPKRWHRTTYRHRTGRETCMITRGDKPLFAGTVKDHVISKIG